MLVILWRFLFFDVIKYLILCKIAQIRLQESIRNRYRDGIFVSSKSSYGSSVDTRHSLWVRTRVPKNDDSGRSAIPGVRLTLTLTPMPGPGNGGPREWGAGTKNDRRLVVAGTSSEYVLQQRHLLCYESEPIP